MGETITAHLDMPAAAQGGVITPEIARDDASVANRRTAEDFAKAQRHSKAVRISRRALPGIAAFMVVLFVGQAVWNWTPMGNIQVLSAAISNGKLVMEEPKLKGVDADNRPYDVKAARAVQDLAKPGFFELTAIDAKLPIDASSFAQVDAGSGIYDQKAETMRLFNTVVVTGARGMDIQMDDADIDIKSGTLTSDKPVTVKSGETTIDAASVEVQDNGKRVIFKERVKMVINRPIKRGTSPEISSAATN
ncbi:MAG: LPS export ABC transporter periplasmic protein LptC [Pseudomonadota bacterium]